MKVKMYLYMIGWCILGHCFIDNMSQVVKLVFNLELQYRIEKVD